MAEKRAEKAPEQPSDGWATPTSPEAQPERVLEKIEKDSEEALSTAVPEEEESAPEVRSTASSADKEAPKAPAPQR